MTLLVSVVLVFARPARAIERTFVGAAPLDYLFVPTAKDANANAAPVLQVFIYGRYIGGATDLEKWLCNRMQ
jgi:hypothetical protein